MRKLTYTQSVYAYMIAVADVDNKISWREAHIIKSLLKRYIGGISDKAMVSISIDFKDNVSPEKYLSFVIDNLKQFKLKKQMEAYKTVTRYVNITKEHKEESRKHAELIRAKLDFSGEEYNRYSLHD